MLRSEEGLKGITAPPLSPRIVVEELTPKPFEEGRSGRSCRGGGGGSSRGE